MNRSQLLMQCKQELANSRANAQTIAHLNLIKARQNPNFLSLEKRQKELTFEIGKLKAFGKDIKKQSAELKEVNQKLNQCLLELNLTKQMLTPKYNCELCQDTGYHSNSMCECLKSNLTKKIVENLGFSNKKLNTFNDFDTNIASDNHQKQLLKIRKKFEQIYQNFGNPDNIKVALLLGQTGVGKTFLTECLASEFIKSQNIVSFLSAFEMNNLFLSYHTTFDDQKQNYIDALLEPDVLFIDDLGTEPVLKNVTKEYLYLLLSERTNNNKLTVITSNLELDAILSRYNERIFSRLCNKRESFVAKIEGKDLRLK